MSSLSWEKPAASLLAPTFPSPIIYHCPLWALSCFLRHFSVPLPMALPLPRLPPDTCPHSSLPLDWCCWSHLSKTVWPQRRQVDKQDLRNSRWDLLASGSLWTVASQRGVLVKSSQAKAGGGFCLLPRGFLLFLFQKVGDFSWATSSHKGNIGMELLEGRLRPQ